MHFLQEIDLETICANCRQKHDNHFATAFDENNTLVHYKSKKCEHCGYEICFKTERDCSGLHH